MTELQSVLLDTLKAFDVFCRKHNLTYFAAFGTCLGAVRHNGFIPWDDDLDVYMLRTDYDKFLSLRGELEGSGYGASDIIDGDHPQTFAKFYTKQCTIWEMKQFPKIIGPWIDVFPIDEWEENDQSSKLYDQFHLNTWNYRKALSKESWKEILLDTIKLNGLNGPIKLVRKFYSPLKYYYLKKSIKNIDSIRQFKGSKLKAWTEVKNEVYDVKWFLEPLYIPYEDTEIPVPIGYDEYLKHRYGDYMKLPPPEQRVGHHNFYYIDLHSVKSIEEIKNDKTLSKNEQKPLSIKVIWDEIKNRKGFKRH